MNYLELTNKSLQRIRGDVPKLTELGEMMAQSLLAGGALFTPQLGTYWPSEFGGRAGGLMGLKPTNYVAQSENDVAFTTPADNPAWRKLAEGKAKIFVIGRPEDVADSRRCAGFTGGAGPDEGVGPLAPLRPFEQLVRGWLTAGEMIVACTRGGRMPIIWMSVWLEGALPRNASFIKHDNVREPWYAPLFHETIYIPPIAPGHVANAFLTELESIHATLSRQSAALATAGQWMSEALRARKQISTVLVGHSYPEILELKENAGYPLSWRPSISDLTHAHPSELGEGDVALHLGYSPVNVADVQRILDRGVRFIYTSPYGRPATLKDHRNLLWLDLPWRPADATVDVPGYSVRILPMSSSAHTIAYFQMLCELATRMGWK